MFLLDVFIAVQFVVQGCIHVQGRSGHRVHRDGDCRQNFVSSGSYVFIGDIAVIAVGEAMAVVTAENNRVSARQRGAEDRHRLKIAIRDRKFLLWENDIVNEATPSCVKDPTVCLQSSFFSLFLPHNNTFSIFFWSCFTHGTKVCEHNWIPLCTISDFHQSNVKSRLKSDLSSDLIFLGKSLGTRRFSDFDVLLRLWNIGSPRSEKTILFTFTPTLLPGG